MTNTPTEDVKSTVDQISRLEKAGCEIIRCTVPDEAAAKALKEIKKKFTFLSLRIFILTTKWLFWQWKTVPTR